MNNPHPTIYIMRHVDGTITVMWDRKYPTFENGRWHPDSLDVRIIAESDGEDIPDWYMPPGMCIGLKAVWQQHPDNRRGAIVPFGLGKETEMSIEDAIEEVAALREYDGNKCAADKHAQQTRERFIEIANPFVGEAALAGSLYEIVTKYFAISLRAGGE